MEKKYRRGHVRIGNCEKYYALTDLRQLIRQLRGTPSTYDDRLIFFHYKMNAWFSEKIKDEVRESSS